MEIDAISYIIFHICMTFVHKILKFISLQVPILLDAGSINFFFSLICTPPDNCYLVCYFDWVLGTGYSVT